MFNVTIILVDRDGARGAHRGDHPCKKKKFNILHVSFLIFIKVYWLAHVYIMLSLHIEISDSVTTDTPSQIESPPIQLRMAGGQIITNNV